MTLYPIAYSQVYWKGFLKELQERGFPSPIAQIENSGYSLNDPGAFIAALDSGKLFPDCIRTSPHLLQHITLTIAHFDDPNLWDTIPLICTRITICPLKRGEPKIYTIVTGSLNQWKDLVVAHCRQGNDLQNLFTEVYWIFSKTSLKQMFADYTIFEDSGGVIMKGCP